eukprot:Pgem_evm1s10007
MNKYEDFNNTNNKSYRRSHYNDNDNKGNKGSRRHNDYIDNNGNKSNNRVYEVASRNSRSTREMGTSEQMYPRHGDSNQRTIRNRSNHPYRINSREYNDNYDNNSNKSNADNIKNCNNNKPPKRYKERFAAHDRYGLNEHTLNYRDRCVEKNNSINDNSSFSNFKPRYRGGNDRYDKGSEYFDHRNHNIHTNNSDFRRSNDPYDCTKFNYV